ncbi:CLUMA_CG020816, isoform A [Clunio marinus]|uniref:CLUMA_CG020816, isoform A n=1 Tax=Clunio marinus TaxID=568069 RepID=A0A1J1J8R4_9DIPT|nr:CLUMA_CG020816, isoform A [Clunio marinus]
MKNVLHRDHSDLDDLDNNEFLLGLPVASFMTTKIWHSNNKLFTTSTLTLFTGICGSRERFFLFMSVYWMILNDKKAKIERKASIQKVVEKKLFSCDASHNWFSSEIGIK